MNHVVSTLACAAAFLVAAAPVDAAELPPGQRHVMDIGHADVIHIRSSDGRLVVDVEDDSGEAPVSRDPGEVLLHAKPDSELAVPDHPAYAFLGAPGDPVWVLPEVQDDRLLWPGWDAEAVDAAQFPTSTLSWRLLDLRGPGEVSVFVSDAVGTPIRFFDTGDPLPQTTSIINRSHTHANWAFEAEGLYVMTVEVLGERADGQTVSSGPIDYHWFVGDLADLPADVPATTLAVDGLRAPYEAGETIALAARQTPDTGERDVRWELRCPGATAWAAAGAGLELRLTAGAGHDGCAVRARLRTSHGTLHATSDPVTLRVVPAPMPVPPAGTPPAADPPGAAPSALRARVTVGRRARTLAAVRRAGAIRLRCALDAAGTCGVRASVDGRIARRLGLGGRRITIGRGRAVLAGPGEATVRVALTRRARAALRAARGDVRVRLIVAASAPGRPRAAIRLATVLRDGRT